MSGMTKEVLAFARGESNILYRKVYLNRFVEDIRRDGRLARAARRHGLAAIVVDATEADR